MSTLQTSFRKKRRIVLHLQFRRLNRRCRRKAAFRLSPETKFKSSIRLKTRKNRGKKTQFILLIFVVVIREFYLKKTSVIIVIWYEMIWNVVTSYSIWNYYTSSQKIVFYFFVISFLDIRWADELWGSERFTRWNVKFRSKKKCWR